MKRDLVKILAATGIAGALAGWGASFAMPKLYVSQAVLSVGGPETKQAQADYMDVLAQRALTRAALIRIIETYDLYQSDRARMELSDVVTQMQKAISIQPVSGSANAFAIRFVYKDPEAAQRVAVDLQRRFLEENKRRVELGVPGVNLQIADVPFVPKHPVSPNTAAITAIGFAAGLALGAVLVFRGRARAQA